MADIPQEEFDKFQEYLAEMDDVLEDFVDTVGAHGYALDFTIDSLDTLEEYWLASSAQPDAERLFQRAVRYYGEVFRKRLGGKWRLSWDNPKSFYYGLPVIVGWAQNPDLEFCPYFVFDNFTARRVKGILRKAVEFDINRAGTRSQPSN